MWYTLIALATGFVWPHDGSTVINSPRVREDNIGISGLYLSLQTATQRACFLFDTWYLVCIHFSQEYGLPGICHYGGADGVIEPNIVGKNSEIVRS